MTSITSLCKMACQVAQKKLEEKQIEEERAAKAKYWKLPICYDDDDDEEISDSLDENIISGLPSFSTITPDEPVLSTEEPDNSLSMGDEHLDPILATELDEFIKSSVENLITIPSESEGIPEHVCDVPFHDNSPPLDVSKDQIEDLSESNEEFSSIDDDAFSIDNIDYVEASPPDYELVSSEVMEIVILERRLIPLIILYPSLKLSALIIELYMMNRQHERMILESVKNDPLVWPSIEENRVTRPKKYFELSATEAIQADCDVKATNIILQGLPPEVYALVSNYKVAKKLWEIIQLLMQGTPLTKQERECKLYDEFDKFAYKKGEHYKGDNPIDAINHMMSFLTIVVTSRSDFYEFTDELIPFISPPEYDCFLFKDEPNSRDFTKDVVEDISPTKKPQVLNALPTHPTLQLNMKFQPASEYLFTYVVWIFLPFLVYSFVPHYLLSLWTEDTIFDPGICNSHFSRPAISHRCGTVKIFNTHRSHLNKCPMLIHGQNNPPLYVLLFHFYPP
nr:hypothetical protein [Tanacetum cinerariifolium]